MLTVPLKPSQFRNHKLVYRRYAGLFFSFCVDANDNELVWLEAIHLFVEVLGESPLLLCPFGFGENGKTELNLPFPFSRSLCASLRRLKSMKIDSLHPSRRILRKRL